jgi:hypothetical protein
MAIFNSYVSLPEGNQIMTQSYSWRITTLSKGPLSIYKWIIPMVKQPTKWDDPPGRLQGCPRGKKHINSSRPTFTNLVGSPGWGFNMASPGFNPRSVGGTKGRTKNLDSRDQAAIIQSFWWQPVLMATKNHESVMVLRLACPMKLYQPGGPHIVQQATEILQDTLQ